MNIDLDFAGSSRLLFGRDVAQISVQFAEKPEDGPRILRERGRDDDHVPRRSVLSTCRNVDHVERRNRMLVVVIRWIQKLEMPAIAQEQSSSNRIRLGANSVRGKARQIPHGGHGIVGTGEEPSHSAQPQHRARLEDRGTLQTVSSTSNEASKFPPAVIIQAPLTEENSRFGVRARRFASASSRMFSGLAPAFSKSERGGYENRLVCSA